MRTPSISELDRQFLGTTTPASELPTLGESLRASVERFAGSFALVDLARGTRMTYAELGDQVGRVARSLIALGVARGDGVGIWAQGSSEWIVTQLAAARVGAVLVTIDAGCDAEQLVQQLRKGDVGVLIMQRAYGALDHVQMVVEALHAFHGLRRSIVLESDWEWFLAYGEAIGDDELADREASLTADDPINVVFEPCSIDDFTVATLSHVDVLCNTCLTTCDGGREWMPLLYQRLSAILGSIVCSAHPACVTI
jgi:fatty-acyl-CoA synthase